MNRHELRAGAAAGLLAASASAGTLIAIGRRASTAARPFNVIASHVIGSRAADSFGFVAAITLTGVVLHVALTVVLGIVALGIVGRRLAPAWLASAAMSLLLGLISVGLARRGTPSLAQLFSLGDLLAYYLILATSLVVGIRFALPSLTKHGVGDASDM